MGRTLLIFLGIGTGAFLLFFFALEGQKPNVVVAGSGVFAQIAKTPEQMERGLSGRSSLKENSGMLFVYETQLIPKFWMKDMRFPLDIIWIGANKEIADITKDVSPDSFPQTFSPKEPVQYVLEINAGWVLRHGVKVGMRVTISP